MKVEKVLQKGAALLACLALALSCVPVALADEAGAAPQGLVAHWAMDALPDGAVLTGSNRYEGEYEPGDDGLEPVVTADAERGDVLRFSLGTDNSGWVGPPSSAFKTADALQSESSLGATFSAWVKWDGSAQNGYVVRAAQKPGDMSDLIIRVNADGTVTAGAPVGKESGYNQPAFTALEGASEDVGASGENFGTVTTHAALTPGVWTHLALAYEHDGNTADGGGYAVGSFVLYMNGAATASATYRAWNWTAGMPSWMVQMQALEFGHRFEGYLSDAALFSRALDAGEVAAVMALDWDNGGEPGDPPDPPDPPEPPEPPDPPDPSDELPDGLLARWDFDEGEGGTAGDGVNAPEAALSGVTWEQGKHGGAAAFNGDFSGGRVEAANAAMNGLNAVTIGAWIRVAQADAAQRGFILSADLDAPANGHASFAWNGQDGKTRLEFSVYGADGGWGNVFSDDIDTSAFDYTAWHHVAAAYDFAAGTVAFYLDGASIGVAQYASTYPAILTPATIGAYFAWGYAGSFKGALDELQVYGRALNAGEIEAVHAFVPAGLGGPDDPGGDTDDGEPDVPFGSLPEGFLGRWPLNKVENNAVEDRVSGQFDPASNVTVAPGKHYATVRTAGNSTSYVGVTRDVSDGAGYTDGLSAALWVNPDTLENLVLFTTQTAGEWFWGQNQLSVGATANGCLSVSLSSSLWAQSAMTPDAGCTLADGDWALLTPEGKLSEKTWQHVAVTYDGSDGQVTVYVDGEYAGGAKLTAKPVLAPAGFWFGTGMVDANNGAYSGGLKGRMDDIVVYNRPLSAAEVEQVYTFVPESDDDSVPELPVGDRVFHVDGANGSDANDGLSRGAAFKTIQAAADIAYPGEEIIVYEGVYEETVRPANSGNAGAPILYRAAPGEKVVVSGADLVQSAWTQAANPAAVQYNAGDANLWKTTAALPLGNYRNQVFAAINGGFEEMLPARYPNVEDGKHPYYQPSWLQYYFSGGTSDGSYGGYNYSTTSGRIRDASLTQPAGAWAGAAVVGMDNREWQLSGAEVTGSEPGWLSLTNLNFYEIGPTGYSPGYFNYYLQNAKAALDAPFEWWYDEGAGELWLQLPEGMSPNGLDVYYKARTMGLDLRGRRNIRVEGIDLLGCSLTTADGENLVVNGMKAEYVSSFLSPGGAVGVTLGGRNNTLINSEIAYASGVLVGISGEGNKVVNCVLHDGTTGPNLFAFALNVSGGGHLISHNEIYNASGALLGGSFYGCEISYNDFHDGNWHCTDSGLLYLAYADYGNTHIHHNQIHDSHTDFSNGLYFDLGCKNVQAYNNVFWNLPWVSVFINSSSEFISVVNNSTYNTAQGGRSTEEIYTNSPGDAYMDVLVNNIVDGRGVGAANANVGAIVRSNYARPNGDTSTYVNPEGQNFTLQAGSGAIGAGEQVWGLHATETPDMGAYPYGEAAWAAGPGAAPVTAEAVSAGPQLPNTALTNLLMNSGFEWARAGLPALGQAIPHWSLTGAQTASIVQAGSAADWARGREQSAVRLTGENDGIEQILTGLVPGVTYVLRASARMGTPGQGADGQRVEIGVRAGGETASGELASASWRTVSLFFTAGASGEATVYATKTTAGSLALVDDFSVARAGFVTDGPPEPPSDDFPMYHAPVALLDDMLYDEALWSAAGQAAFTVGEATGLALQAQAGQRASALFTNEKYGDKDFYLRLAASEDLDALDLSIILRANGTVLNDNTNRYEIDIDGGTAKLFRTYNGNRYPLGPAQGWAVDITDPLLKAYTSWVDNGSGYGVVTITLKSGDDVLFSYEDENNLNISTDGYFGVATDSAVSLARVAEYVNVANLMADTANWVAPGGSSLAWGDGGARLTPPVGPGAGYTGRTFGDAEFVLGFESSLSPAAFPSISLRIQTEEQITTAPWEDMRYGFYIKHDIFEIQQNAGGILKVDDNKGFVPQDVATLLKVSAVNTDYGVWLRMKVGDTIVASWMDADNFITGEGYFGICGYSEAVTLIAPGPGLYAPDIGDPDATPGAAQADKTALRDKAAAAETLLEEDYTPASWAEFAAALAGARAVLANDEATQAAVDAALSALNGAMTGLESAAQLSAALQALAGEVAYFEGLGLNAQDYFSGAWDTWQTALDAAKALLAAPAGVTDAAALAAAAALQDAWAALPASRVPDKTNLRIAIEAATALLADGTGGYIPWSVQRLTQALAVANNVNNDANATKAEVDAAWNELVNAVTSMFERADKAALQALVDIVSGLEETGFTPASWQPFAAALADARALLADENAMGAEVETAYAALNAARSSLVPRADMSALGAAIARAEQIVAGADSYVPATLDSLAETLETAKAVYTNLNATQAEADAANQALNAALLKARLKPDRSLLQQSIFAASALNLSLYTAETVQPLQEALEEAQALMAQSDEILLQEDLDAMTARLYDLMGRLKLKPTTPPVTETPQPPAPPRGGGLPPAPQPAAPPAAAAGTPVPGAPEATTDTEPDGQAVTPAPASPEAAREDAQHLPEATVPAVVAPDTPEGSEGMVSVWVPVVVAVPALVLCALALWVLLKNRKRREEK